MFGTNYNKMRTFWVFFFFLIRENGKFLQALKKPNFF